MRILKYKRVFAAIVAATFLFAVAACGKDAPILGGPPGATARGELE